MQSLYKYRKWEADDIVMESLFKRYSTPQQSDTVRAARVSLGDSATWLDCFLLRGVKYTSKNGSATTAIPETLSVDLPMCRLFLVRYEPVFTAGLAGRAMLKDKFDALFIRSSQTMLEPRLMMTGQTV